jgi:hypothetical protein
MKKIVVTSICSLILFSAFGPIVTVAWAETMNFELVSMVEKMERVQVTGIEGGCYWCFGQKRHEHV